MPDNIHEILLEHPFLRFAELFSFSDYRICLLQVGQFFSAVLIIISSPYLPKISDLELARIVGTTTGLRLHHETVKAMLDRYFFWLSRDLHDQIYISCT
jgi:hypothetical protein